MIEQSAVLKQAALNWLRFCRGYSFIGTEVGSFSADCFGASFSKAVEIEVKCSLSDFRRDFIKRKHTQYASAAKACRYDRLWIPNQYYMLVPPSIRDRAELLLREYPHCGLMIYRSEALLDRQVEVAKRAPALHGNAPAQSVIQALGARMSSELITHYFFKAYLDEEKRRLSVLFSSIKTLAERAMERAGEHEQEIESDNGRVRNETGTSGVQERERDLGRDEGARAPAEAVAQDDGGGAVD